MIELRFGECMLLCISLLQGDVRCVAEDAWEQQQSAGEKRRAFDDDTVSDGDKDEERCHKLSFNDREIERHRNCTPSERRDAGRISMLNGRASALYTPGRYVTAICIQREENYTP